MLLSARGPLPASRLIFWVVVVEEGEEGRRRRCGGRGKEGVELSWARGVCGAGDGQGTNNVPAPPGGGAPVNCTFPLPGPGRGGWVRGRAVSDPTLPKAREGCWRRRGAGAGAGAGAGLGWAGLGCSRCGGLPRRAGGGHFFPAGYDSARGPVVRGCAQRDLTTHGHQPSAPTGNWGRDEAEVRTEFSCSLRACTRGKKRMVPARTRRRTQRLHWQVIPVAAGGFVRPTAAALPCTLRGLVS